MKRYSPNQFMAKFAAAYTRPNGGAAAIVANNGLSTGKNHTGVSELLK